MSRPTTLESSQRVPLPGPEQLYVTDAGLETELVFADGLELPHFLQSETGRERLRSYYRAFTELAHRHGLGLVLETPTWRSSPDWAERLGLGREGTLRLSADAMRLLETLRRASPLPRERFVISGNLGPRYDGYAGDQRMEPDAAAAYHRAQIACFAREGADVVSALTLTTSTEGAGIARAAAEVEIPAVICFTVETDGRLPSGEPLGEAIAAVDAAAPGAVAYFGINCAHPTHFLGAIEETRGSVGRRIGMVRANASKLSHAELDACTELDDGDPDELATHYGELRRLLPALRVLGGCCGTDIRHVARICEVCAAA